MDILLNGIHNLISFLVIISIIVFIHEYGHYFVAKISGVKIEVFSIGFGKELLGWNDKSGTRWKISLIPLGGYVKMFGDKDVSSSPNNEFLTQLSEEEQNLTFHKKPLLIKSLIVAAGPAFNYFLAIIILTFFFSFYGMPYSAPIIDDIQQDSVAERAGLKVGDRIVAINGNKIEKFLDIQPIVTINANQQLDFIIERNKEQFSIKLTPEVIEKTDLFGNNISVGKIGIASKTTEIKKYSIFKSIHLSIKDCWFISVTTLRVIGEIITGKRNTDELSGPIKIAKYSGQSTKKGLQVSLWFMAMLSINLGLINLLPIPMLDGGHLFYYMIEAISGKPVSENIQKFGFIIGLFIIISLSLFAVFNDLISLKLF